MFETKHVHEYFIKKLRVEEPVADANQQWLRLAQIPMERSLYVLSGLTHEVLAVRGIAENLDHVWRHNHSLILDADKADAVKKLQALVDEKGETSKRFAMYECLLCGTLI